MQAIEKDLRERANRRHSNRYSAGLAGDAGPIDEALIGQSRWYDSSTGRWIVPDPTGFAAGDTNLDRYVGNSPANAVDPSGLADYGFPNSKFGKNWRDPSPNQVPAAPAPPPSGSAPNAPAITKQQYEAEIARIDAKIAEMVAYASDGHNHTVKEAQLRFPEISNAGGGREWELIEKLPVFVRQALLDVENDWTIDGLQFTYWFEEWVGSSLPNCIFDNGTWNTGNGDVWVRMEILHFQYWKLRIRDIYLGSQ